MGTPCSRWRYSSTPAHECQASVCIEQLSVSSGRAPLKRACCSSPHVDESLPKQRRWLAGLGMHEWVYWVAAIAFRRDGGCRRPAIRRMARRCGKRAATGSRGTSSSQESSATGIPRMGWTHADGRCLRGSAGPPPHRRPRDSPPVRWPGAIPARPIRVCLFHLWYHADHIGSTRWPPEPPHPRRRRMPGRRRHSPSRGPWHSPAATTRRTGRQTRDRPLTPPATPAPPPRAPPPARTPPPRPPAPHTGRRRDAGG